MSSADTQAGSSVVAELVEVRLSLYMSSAGGGVTK